MIALLYLQNSKVKCQNCNSFMSTQFPINSYMITVITASPIHIITSCSLNADFYSYKIMFANINRYL